MFCPKCGNSTLDGKCIKCGFSGDEEKNILENAETFQEDPMKKKASDLAEKAFNAGIISLFCGIVCIILFWFPLVSIPCSVFSLISAVSCFLNGKRLKAIGIPSKRYSAGKVLAIIGISISCLWALWMLALILLI